jgi:CBS-domain-containing membrane protein
MSKLSGGGQLPKRPEFKEMLRGLVGGFISIFGLTLLTDITTYPMLMAPFGATCVILYAASASPLAQPRNVIGGHLVSAFIGLLALYLFGSSAVVMAFAVGASIAAMQFFRVVHPPAGANPLVIIIAGISGFDFLLFPVLFGSIFLVGVAAIINNIGLDNKWPVYWHGFSRKKV